MMQIRENRFKTVLRLFIRLTPALVRARVLVAKIVDR